MKIAKILSVFFALVAVAIMAVTAAAYVRFHQTPPMIQTPVEDAEAKAEMLMEAICQGDYAVAGECLYGNPALQWNQETASELGAALWEAYNSTLSYEFAGPCYGTGSGIYRDVTVTALDISALRPKIQERFEILMEPYLADAQYDSEAFDENGALRQEFAAEKLQKAVEQVLWLDNEFASRQITLELVYQNGQWWVMPTQNLVDIVSGAVAP